MNYIHTCSQTKKPAIAFHAGMKPLLSIESGESKMRSARGTWRGLAVVAAAVRLCDTAAGTCISSTSDSIGVPSCWSKPSEFLGLQTTLSTCHGEPTSPFPESAPETAALASRLTRSRIP
mmetsp:Transcript_128301/g.256249  ORF Transcript_128301/g.256249 Transcript_128301/m.256249 type:complete len:120 (-) Transcript_128301:1275-1634(-)